MSKKTLVLSPGVKKGKIPHIPQTQKKNQIFQKNIFAFFCELNHSEQENQKKKFGTFFSHVTLNIPETFSISILMILILTIFNFQFTCFCFLPHLCALQLWTQKMLEQKFSFFFLISILMIFILINFNVHFTRFCFLLVSSSTL